eukprot:TRINITY_DN24587_c0_g1_i1.p1 TRINITY_DN24587_c0_g1~~TRINITY_DN24587_c0_g1_i1.p1  ORF type:complete len:352 (+),score=45.18 TRINITY_DN24587_c0_g1_i1:92-1147(+)
MASVPCRMTCNAASLGSLSSVSHLASARAGVRVVSKSGRYFAGPRAEIAQDTEATSSGGVDTPSSSTGDSISAYKIPEPKRFFVRQDKYVDIGTAALNIPLRFGTGLFVSGYQTTLVPKPEVAVDTYTFLSVAGYTLIESSNLGRRPEKPIELYEFEGCPFCRKVREIVAVLDLDVLYYPCPQDGPNFRPKAIKLGGKKKFPYMVDPNSGVSMYESDDIIQFLAEKYGDGNVPLSLKLGPLTTLTAGFAMLGRAGKGSKYVPAKQPEKPIELWAHEASPFCKLVREALVELELPHLLHSTARGSFRRSELLQRTGTFQVPYIEDPNTGVKMFESAEIVDYLQAEYARPQGA